MYKPVNLDAKALLFSFSLIFITATGQDTWLLYPHLHESLPSIVSPTVVNDSMEVIVAVTNEEKYAIVPVTQENGSPLLYSNKVKSVMGKDQQLSVGAADFPTLGRTGLHSYEELENKEMITGIPVEIITVIGRPKGFSHAGFMADDEDIISVLINDNQTVSALGLTHPMLAKPLFHIWNLILKEIELGKWARNYDNFRVIHYNGHELAFKAHGTKGWQVSIFNDEIQGSFGININREFTVEEEAYLRENYSHLSQDQMNEMSEKLTHILFSEMLPYYIMRYGFYEGHTVYRCDPVAVAFIFGLKSLEEIDRATDGDLFRALTRHFVATD